MKDILVEIWSSLRQNKLRTCLTGFSVAWGIFMIIALQGAGNGLINAMNSSNEGTMKNSMTVYGGVTTMPYDGYDEGRWFGLDTKDVDNLKSRKFRKHVDEVSPSVDKSGTATYGQEYVSTLDLKGIAPVYKSIEGIKMVCGRFIDQKDMDDMSKVIVLSNLDARTLMGGRDNPEAMLGKMVSFGGIAYKVVGIFFRDESEWGHPAYAPYSLIHTLYSNDKNIGELAFSFKNIETTQQADAFKDSYKKTVLRNHDASPEDLNAVFISDRFSQNEQMNKGTRIIRTALWIFGLLTLISGIVGVSNIMLITVKERTHEFGIRKALGAKPSSILWLIIAESILITAAFGYLGMFVGMAANHVMDMVFSNKGIQIADMTFYIFKNPSVDIWTAIKATMTMIIAGTLAGLIPARKAARVMPIEALRAD